MGLLNTLQISLGKDNVVIPSVTMFCHWVIDMEAVHLPLNYLPQVLVWSSNNWSPSDYPYLSHDGFKIVSIFLYLVISGFLVCLLTNLLVFLNKLLEPSPLDQLLYLFFQIPALVYVMSMVFMEATDFFRSLRFEDKLNGLGHSRQGHLLSAWGSYPQALSKGWSLTSSLMMPPDYFC